MPFQHHVASLVLDTLDYGQRIPQALAMHRHTLLTLAKAVACKDIKPEHAPLLHDLAQQVHSLMHAMGPADLYFCRRIHTDCCIIQSLLESYLGATMDAIAALDHALIISGALGPGRFALVHELIQVLQSTMPSPDAASVHSRLSPQNQTDVGHSPPAASHIIPKIPPPSITSFQTNFHQTPFIISGYAEDWPALQEHPWNRASYLRSVAGPGRMVPLEVGGHYMLDNWTQRIMSWDEFLTMLDFEDQPTKTETENKHYLAQHNLFLQFPSLRNDILIPDYVYATGDVPDYKPPDNEEGLITNIWLGPKNTISPAHSDPYNNFYVQIMGRKTVWLAPPATKLAGGTEGSLSNTSILDVFGPVDSDFRKHIEPNAMCAVLEPGDLLYIPVGWWHAMRSESTSFSLSLWF